MNVFQNNHTFVTVHLKGLKCVSFLVGDALNNSDTNQASSTENDNETLTHEEDISDDDDVISDPDYTPSCDESSAPENEDSLTMVATTPEQEDEDVDLNNTVKRKRNKLLSPGTWKQNKSKEKRVKGMSYKSKGGKEMSTKAFLQLEILSASLNSRLPHHYRRAVAVDISEDLGNEHLGRTLVIRHHFGHKG